MQTIRRSLLGFWVLISVFLFKAIYSYVAYQDLKKVPGMNPDTIERFLFSAIEITVFAIVLTEAIIYWLLRYKIRNILWVRLHVFTLFFVLVLIPSSIIVIYFLTGKGESEDFGILVGHISHVRFYLFWILMPVAHVFFIASIVQSFKPIKETKNDEEPAGLLDEFID